MTRPDESIIRDENLLVLVAQQRAKGLSGPLLDTFLRIQIDAQTKRDMAAAEATRKASHLQSLAPLARRQQIVKKVIEDEPATPESLKYIHSVLALCGLPVRRLPSRERSFERINGRMAIVVHAGELRSPDGERVQLPVPFGPKARLLMAHLSSEAVRNNSATIEIADSLSAFMREMAWRSEGRPRNHSTVQGSGECPRSLPHGAERVGWSAIPHHQGRPVPKSRYGA